MKTVQEHYAEHLAPIYLWSVGGSQAAFSLAESELDALGLPAANADSILDLGAGFGMHSVPLARRGAAVTAVDSSDELLRSLESLADGLPIKVVQDDLIHFMESNRESYAAILCMGDTITHLRKMEDVNELLGYAHQALQPGGTLVLSFRDYTNPLTGEQRFLPVRSDAERIHTCFLEYQKTAVCVHDIVHELKQEQWQMRVSAYSKLRIAPDDLIATLLAIGHSARKEAGLRGMVRIVATKH